MSGITFTDAELTAWRGRASDSNYSAEWTDIKGMADEALGGSYDAYTNYHTSGVWPTYADVGSLVYELEPRDEQRSSQSVLGAAFCWVLGMATTGYNQTQHDNLKALVISEIERYAGIGQLDWSSNESLGSGYIFPFFQSGNPGFFMAEWMIKLLTAYDYIGGSGESAIADTWFGDFADYCYLNSLDEYNGKLPGRMTRDYSTISGGYNDTDIGGMWTGSGIDVYGLNGIYNNRMAPYLRFLSMYAFMYNDTTYKDYCKLWWKEFIAYGCTGDCDWHEYQRSKWDDPEAVTRYCGVSVSSLAWVADIFARNADTDLYDYVLDLTEYDIFYTAGNLSRGGIVTAEGLNKTLYKVIDQFLKLYDSTYSRFVGGELINGYTTTWVGGAYWLQDYINDQLFRQSNLWYNDSNWKAIYNRTKAGTRTLNKTRPIGNFDQIRGIWATQPSHFFMYQDFEGVLDPYGGSTPTPQPSTSGTSTRRRRYN